MSKELYIAAHEAEMEAYLEANPDATDEEAYEATSEAAYVRMHDRHEANARLIAAAPELLELLEKASLFVGWAYTRQQVVAGVHAEELVDAIDAAIAKARGQA